MIILAVGLTLLVLCATWLLLVGWDISPHGLIVAMIVVIVVWVAALAPALARDDGRFSGSPLKPWFDSLKSGQGPCCSNADGEIVSDPDWETKGGHYRVRLKNVWVDVPDNAVITEPNRAGRTMVWPYYINGDPIIRCFLPGSMT